jgi:flavin reductase (DIM6/NTAB) family NADH-FMN oxidoreductase RutF
MDEAAKKSLLRMIPYGLYVLGARDGEHLAMSTINWVTQAAFQPPLLAMGVKRDSKGHELLKASRRFALSLLKTGQKEQAYAFFKPSKLESGTINGQPFWPAGNGCPTLAGAAGYVAGTITDIVERGDHSVFIGEVTEAVQHEGAEILTLKEIGATYGG